jgi:hypothetical protein
MSRLETDPLTPNQLGAVMHEFERLGFHPWRDRDERLAACSALLGRDALASVYDLLMGEAGKLLRTLQGFPDRAALDAALTELAAPPSLLQWLARLLLKLGS